MSLQGDAEDPYEIIDDDNRLHRFEIPLARIAQQAGDRATSNIPALRKFDELSNDFERIKRRAYQKLAELDELKPILELRSQFLELKQEHEQLGQSLREAKENRDSLTAQLDSARENQAVLEQYKSKTEQDFEVQATKLKDLEQQLAKSKQDIVSKDSEITKYQQDISDKDTNATKLGQELNTIRAGKESLEAELRQLRQENEALKKNSEQNASELNKLQHELDNVKAQGQQQDIEMKSKFDGLRSELQSTKDNAQEQARQQASENSSKISDLRGQIQELEDQVDDSAVFQAEMQSELENVKARDIEKSASLDKLQDEVMTAQTQARERDTENASKIATLEKQMTSVRDQSAAELQNLRWEYDNFKRQTEHNIKRRDSELAKVGEDLKQKNIVLDDLHKQLNDKKGELANKQVELDGLGQSLARFQVEARNELDTMEVSLAALQDEVHGLEAEVGQRDDQLESTRAERDVAASELDDLQSRSDVEFLAMSKQLDDAEEENLRLEESQAAFDQLHERNLYLESNVGRDDVLFQELAEAQNQLALHKNCNATVANFRAEKNEAKRLAIRRGQEIERLTPLANRAEQLEQHIETLDAKLVRLTNKVENMRRYKTISSIQTDRAKELQGALNAANNKIVELRQSQNDLLASSKAAARREKTLLDNFNTLAAQCARMRQGIRAMEQRLSGR